MDREALKQMTVAELREEAKKIPDAKGISSMKKDELIELILGHAGGDDGPTAPSPSPPAPKNKAAKGKPTSPGKAIDRSDIKQQIRALKEEKREALSQKDGKRAKACNRQIHDCKRLLRKMTRTAPSKRS